MNFFKDEPANDTAPSADASPPIGDYDKRNSRSPFQKICSPYGCSNPSLTVVFLLTFGMLKIFGGNQGFCDGVSKLAIMTKEPVRVIISSNKLT